MSHQTYPGLVLEARGVIYDVAVDKDPSNGLWVLTVKVGAGEYRQTGRDQSACLEGLRNRIVYGQALTQAKPSPRAAQQLGLF